ncbi:hypothetical protein IJ531_00545, partial [bacterium]|nr:hypothetical protein [bacterium]
MPISVNNDLSRVLAHAVYHIENPNYQTGTLLEEVPADIGRAYHGYKRGGIIEGAEKFRKETMAAVVWLFGIPAFNKLGTLICEKLLHLPMGMDFSDAARGNDAIGDTIRFLKGEIKETNLDTSEIAKYAKMQLSGSSEDIIKNVKLAKNITSNAAVVLNCLAMGVLIPKINQALTRKKIAKMNNEKTAIRNNSFDSFSKKTQNNAQPSFTGSFGDFVGNITYLTENSNKFRLIITDVPMIIGRMITSRN